LGKRILQAGYGPNAAMVAEVKEEKA
jgi:hypothetical protein